MVTYPSDTEPYVKGIYKNVQYLSQTFYVLEKIIRASCELVCGESIMLFYNNEHILET